MRYMKALDIHAYGRAVSEGQIKLQRGQWIRLGNDNPILSRFHSVRPGSGVIWAFHGPTATRRFLDLCAEQRDADREREERARMRAWACALTA